MKKQIMQKNEIGQEKVGICSEDEKIFTFFNYFHLFGKLCFMCTMAIVPASSFKYFVHSIDFNDRTFMKGGFSAGWLYRNALVVAG